MIYFLSHSKRIIKICQDSHGEYGLNSGWDYVSILFHVFGVTYEKSIDEQDSMLARLRNSIS